MVPGGEFTTVWQVLDSFLQTHCCYNITLFIPPEVILKYISIARIHNYLQKKNIKIRAMAYVSLHNIEQCIIK